MTLDDDLRYLESSLGLHAEVSEWDGEKSLPLYLKSNTEIRAAKAGGVSFLLARALGEPSLPDLKRLHAQLSKRTDIPVAVSAPTADARQRHALVSQGIPFVCAGKQASLPFLGAASTEWGKGRLEAALKTKLTPVAQQTAIWGALQNRPYALAELRKATSMSASQASNAIGELVRRGMAKREKRGREVIVEPIGIDRLLDEHMHCLSSPVVRTMFVKRCPLAEALPDASETALAARGALNPPSIARKAASRADAKALAEIEILEGELPDHDTLQVQIWKYAPLAAGADGIDNVSLALSLSASDDERIESEVESLFGREYAWQEAR